MTRRLAGRMLDLVVAVATAHTDVLGRAADRAADACEAAAELLRLAAILTRACP